MNSFLNEFKKFALRGNVMDMAVGIIIGAAFTKIVDSTVKDLIMPPLGLLVGKVDFSNLFLTLSESPTTPGPYPTLEAAQKAGALTLNLGLFFNVLLSFLLIALSVFILIKMMNKVSEKLTSPTEAAAPTTKTCPFCCSKIPVAATKCAFCTSEQAPSS